MNNKVIEVKNLFYTIDKKNLLNNVNISVEKKEFVGLIGPNGSGKSTLLKNIYKQYSSKKGTIYINNKSIENINNKELAKNMAVVTQENKMEFDFSIWEVIRMSRLPYHGLFDMNTKNDDEICLNALKKVGMEDMKYRSFPSLSGGEKQRVYLAMAFAQESKIIVLDEPTNHLDIGYQLMLMDLLKNENNTTIFTSLHDMNLAARYCHKIIVLDKGQVVAYGQPKEVLTLELLRDIFKIDAEIHIDKDTDKLTVLYKSFINN